MFRIFSVAVLIALQTSIAHAYTFQVGDHAVYLGLSFSGRQEHNLVTVTKVLSNAAMTHVYVDDNGNDTEVVDLSLLMPHAPRCIHWYQIGADLCSGADAVIYAPEWPGTPYTPKWGIFPATLTAFWNYEASSDLVDTTMTTVHSELGDVDMLDVAAQTHGQGIFVHVDATQIPAGKNLCAGVKGGISYRDASENSPFYICLGQQTTDPVGITREFYRDLGDANRILIHSVGVHPKDHEAWSFASGVLK